MGEGLGQRRGEQIGHGLLQALPLALENGGDHLVESGEWKINVGNLQWVECHHRNVNLRSRDKCLAWDVEVVVDCSPVLGDDAEAGAGGVAGRGGEPLSHLQLEGESGGYPTQTPQPRPASDI